MDEKERRREMRRKEATLDVDEVRRQGAQQLRHGETMGGVRCGVIVDRVIR